MWIAWMRPYLWAPPHISQYLQLPPRATPKSQPVHQNSGGTFSRSQKRSSIQRLDENAI